MAKLVEDQSGAAKPPARARKKRGAS